MCSSTQQCLAPRCIRRCPVNSTCLGGGMAPQLGQLSFDNIFSALFYDFLILSTMWWGQVSCCLLRAATGGIMRHP